VTVQTCCSLFSCLYPKAVASRYQPPIILSHGDSKLRLWGLTAALEPLSAYYVVGRCWLRYTTDRRVQLSAVCADDHGIEIEILITFWHLQREVWCLPVPARHSSQRDVVVHRLAILSKCAKRIYCIWNLSKAGLPACDIVHIYCSVVRSVLE